MKPQLTLPQHPQFLFALPILNLFSILLYLFIIGPSMMLQNGIQVEMPTSIFQLERPENSLIITIKAGTPEQLYLGTNPLSKNDLWKNLEKIPPESRREQTILLHCDRSVPLETSREISEHILSLGFHLNWVGNPPTSPTHTQ